ncbi:ketosynthase [Streptomyces sp. EAS-AB2608]|uniref:beta-ketoacyl-[acyl-carrier-protein] synthase family protein n=1 Tax=Streptomyces sp. EAS-AB2608 TaxID=2779671 RepID=UPI001BEF3E15|nr:beta-ketoacyl-[acyl-carrier-protein] synthase family protein [Streptomyces sp. EAS-AB2608]BCM65022.1 ketosynthase [Streptomyces sp. EAS-AB2608]
MRRSRTVVTGIGLATPGGVGAEATWRRLCAGTPTASTDPRLAGLPVDFSCRVPDEELTAALGPGLRWRTDRFIHLALAAAREAVQDAGLAPGEWDADRVGVVIGVGSSSRDTDLPVVQRLTSGEYQKISPTTVPRALPNMAAGEIAADLGAKGPGFGVSTACASGATAIGVGRQLLSGGLCDIALVGGAESGCGPLAGMGFWRLGALSARRHDPAGASRPFDTERDGFVLAEGAGVLVLERAEHARARGATARAVLSGFGATSDAHHPTSPHPDGEGAARAVRAALAEADLTPDDVHHVNAHATSTPLNDRVEAAVLHRIFRRPPPVTATKSILGHSLGAAGAVEAAVCVLSLHHQTVHPTANLDAPEPGIDLDIVTKAPRTCRIDTVLSTSFGFGGQNAVLVLQTP